jgi:hypothetical protein
VLIASAKEVGYTGDRRIVEMGSQSFPQVSGLSHVKDRIASGQSVNAARLNHAIDPSFIECEWTVSEGHCLFYLLPQIDSLQKPSSSVVLLTVDNCTQMSANSFNGPYMVG